MGNRLKHQRGSQPGKTVETEITWRHVDRIAPGEYRAYSRSAAVYRDPGFRRWVCAVQFDVLDSAGGTIARLTWYLNLGTRGKPHVGRRSNYWIAWVKAHAREPKRTDRLSPTVFEKRYAEVRVRDTAKDHRQVAVKQNEGYSVVGDVLNWETGGRER
jgi:hypothetical protein